jgi:molybdate/tungstate transport system permease protein
VALAVTAAADPGAKPRWARHLPPSHPHGVFLVCWLLGGLLGAFIVVPLLALAATPSAASLAAAARTADLWQALRLSLEAALLAAIVAGLLGVPLAYLLARSDFRGKSLVAAIVDLPLAVPHTVAGIALLLVLGRDGIVGAPAAAIFGLRFWGTLAGIVAAMLFVSVPYTVNAARIGFEGVDPRLEKIARTLGLGPWHTCLRITLPLARRSILTGLTLTYARSISEFGAVMILAYYPMTAPVRIYTLFVGSGLDEAAAASVMLLAVSLALFILFRRLAFGNGIGAMGSR